MADDKIQISWAEVASAEVDAKLKHQTALGRAQQHYEQQPQPTLPGLTPSALGQHRTSFWRHSVIYMSLFGLIGGLCAWGLGEIALQTDPSRRLEATELVAAAQWIEQARAKGELSEAQATAEYSELERLGKDNPYMKIWQSSLSEEEKSRQIESLVSRDVSSEFFAHLAFYGACGAMIAFWLSVAEPVVGRNMHSAVVHGAIGAALGLLGGAIVSLFIDKLYQAMGGGRLDGNGSFGGQMLARAIAWAIIGLFLAIAPGVVLRNWKRMLVGLAGGLIGGLLGGLLFDPIVHTTRSDVFSRFVGILAIGLLAGVCTGLIENAAKSGWLRVVAGLIAGKQFVLYRNPTYIGSSPQCEIYLFKDAQVAPRHAAIRMIPGGFEIEDLRSASGTFLNGQNVNRQRLKTGDQLQVGGTAFTFGEKRK